MSLTFEESYDSIYGLFKAAWDPTSYPAYYEAVDKGRMPDDQPWVWVSIEHAGGRQASLSSGTGQARFERNGIFTARIFVAAGKGLQDALPLAKVVADAFEGNSAPGGVWFRNVRMNEVGRDGKFFQVNVLAEFTYDEIK